MSTRKERIKDYILIWLISLSVLQLGFYWTYQNKDMLTTFWNKIYKRDKTSFEINEFFRPDRIIVSEGFDGNHFILKKNIQEYNYLWNDAKKYLKEFLKTGDYEEETPYTDEIWGNIIIKKSIMLEFDGDIDSALISTFLGNNFKANILPQNIKKVVMQPFESVNNTMIFYVASKDNIVKVCSPIKQNRLSKEFYDNLINSVSDKNILTNYSLMKEIFPNNTTAPFNICSDVLIAIDENSVERYNTYFSMLPILLDDITLNDNSDLDDLSEEILGSNKDYYDIGVDLDNTIVFKNLESIFRIYKDGLLEYKYLGNIHDDLGNNIAKSFKKTTEFVAGLKELIEGADITLVKTEKVTNKDMQGYKFIFDYKLDDVPVVINNYKSNVIPDVTLNNAIEIISTNSRVVSCFWILRDFDTAITDVEYCVGFAQLLDDLFVQYNLDKDRFQILDIDDSYVINFEEEDVLVPNIMIKSSDRDYYMLPFTRKDERIGLVSG